MSIVLTPRECMRRFLNFLVASASSASPILAPFGGSVYRPFAPFHVIIANRDFFHTEEELEKLISMVYVLPID